MAPDRGEDRRITFKNAFEIAVTLIGGMAMILWLVVSDQVKDARADIKTLYQTKADLDRLVALEKKHEALMQALEDQRDTLNSHVIASGAGRVVKRRHP